MPKVSSSDQGSLISPKRPPRDSPAGQSFTSLTQRSIPGASGRTGSATSGKTPNYEMFGRRSVLTGASSSASSKSMGSQPLLLMDQEEEDDDGDEIVERKGIRNETVV